MTRMIIAAHVPRAVDGHKQARRPTPPERHEPRRGLIAMLRSLRAKRSRPTPERAQRPRPTTAALTDKA